MLLMVCASVLGISTKSQAKVAVKIKTDCRKWVSLAFAKPGLGLYQRKLTACVLCLLNKALLYSPGLATEQVGRSLLEPLRWSDPRF